MKRQKATTEGRLACSGSSTCRATELSTTSIRDDEGGERRSCNDESAELWQRAARWRSQKSNKALSSTPRWRSAPLPPKDFARSCAHVGSLLSRPLACASPLSSPVAP